MAARFGAAPLVDLTDRGTERQSERDDGIIDAALGRAQHEIDAVLAGVAAVPFGEDSVPPLIKDVCMTLGWVFLHEVLPELPDAVTAQGREARTLLASIASGAISLGGTVGGDGEVARQEGVVAAGGAAGGGGLGLAGTGDWA